MRTQKRSGFTIIEVMLFLAITGALTVAILVGSGVAISQQRYRDSVNSFKGLIQEQYGLIANVINSEAKNRVCIPSDGTLLFKDGTEQRRGTSECLVMGRFVVIDQTQVKAYNLIGRPPAEVTKDMEVSDDTLLKEYALAVQTPEEYEVSWGAKIVHPKTKNGITAGILIIRSPLSGSILTYTQDLPETDVKEEARLNTVIRSMITADNTAQKDFCVDSQGSSGMGRRLAVRMGARASSQSAVEIPLEEENVCD